MYKLLIFTVVGLCSLLVVKCDEEFYEEWKEYMEKSYCKAENKDDKEKYLDCCELFPNKVIEIIFKETGKDDMRGAMDLLCTDEEMGKKVCREMKDNKEHLGMDEDAMKKLRECKDQ